MGDYEVERKRFTAVVIIIIIFLIGLTISLLYNNNKYKVTFITNTNESLLARHVKKGSKISKPVKLEKEGYIFKYWKLNGKEYDFDSKINKNITLEAVWEKEEYINIVFINNDIKLDKLKILKDTSIKSFPDVKLEGCTFNGWYYDDKLYEGEPLSKDTYLISKYDCEIDKIKIKDKVLIIGEYSNSAYTNTINRRAIGWKREVLDIIEDSINPYVIGLGDEILGYFKAESIKKIED